MINRIPDLFLFSHKVKLATEMGLLGSWCETLDMFLFHYSLPHTSADVIFQIWP